jgi:hypothetical protein
LVGRDFGLAAELTAPTSPRLVIVFASPTTRRDWRHRPPRASCSQEGVSYSVVYAIAVRQLLPSLTAVISRLIFLGEEAISADLRDDALERAALEVEDYLDRACALLNQGHACPGPDAQDPYNDFRLALPADRDGYFQRKGTAFRNACRELSPLWGRP